MNKSFRFAVVVLALGLSTGALAEDGGHFYVGGGVGAGVQKLDVGFSHDSTRWELNSIRLNNLSVPADSAAFVGASVAVDLLYVIKDNAEDKNHPIQSFSLPIRLGYGTATTTYGSGAASSKFNGLYMGMGVEYALTKHIEVTGEWTQIEHAVSSLGNGLSAKENLYTAGLKFNF